MIPVIYRDNYDLIVTSQKDGGDTMQREAMLVCLLRLGRRASVDAVRTRFRWVLALLQCLRRDHYYMRHPDQSKWYSDCDRLSRDQATPLVAALAMCGFRDKLLGFFLAHLRRGMFMTNTRRNGATRSNHGQVYKHVNGKPIKRNYGWKLPDWCGPEFWALYIRAFYAWPLYPLLLVLDLSTLIGGIFRATIGKKDNDILNHCIITALGLQVLPTPWMWLTFYINRWGGAKQKLEGYFDYDRGPWFMEYWRDLV